jgi:hypothetical protein
VHWWENCGTERTSLHCDHLCMFRRPKNLKRKLLGGGVEGETRAGFVLKRQGVLQSWCRRTEVTFRLLRWAQTSFSSAARWFSRRGQKPTSSAASYFEPRTLCSGVEGPGCLSILNFEQLISSCNLEVKLEASSLRFFSYFACCKLFRSKILHVLFVSALSFWRSFQSNCTDV